MNPEVTALLRQIDAGDAEATRQLFDLLYRELRALAHARMAQEAPGDTLQATALVHEVYLRLIGSKRPEDHEWRGRGHFIGATAETMRRVLVDRARQKRSQKRGGDHRRLEIDPQLLSYDAPPAGLLELDEALTAFEAIDPTKAALVKLRFFAGLTLAEAVAILGLKSSTADRAWSYAKTWLYERIENS